MKIALHLFTILTVTGFLKVLHAQNPPDIEWQKSFGGLDIDIAYSIQQTTDRGFIIAGSTASSPVSGNNGLSDYWILKTDSSGNVSWEKSLGGSDYDYAQSIQMTNDGGFIVAGYSYSADLDVTGHHESSDYWIVKLDMNGDFQWQKSLGGIGEDQAYSILQTSDSGFMIAGWSTSYDGDVGGNHGLSDYWIVRLDAGGSLVWQKCFGGSGDDKAYSIGQTTDDGFIVAGWSTSNDGDVGGNYGLSDYWILKLDADGNLEWENFFGGSYDDEASTVQQTTDGGFIVAGTSYSVDEDVSGSIGGGDYWVLKLDNAGNLQWEKSYGGDLEDLAGCIQQTTDGGFVVAGKSESVVINGSVNHGHHDFWIAKSDSDGDLLWGKFFGGSKEDVAFSIQQTNDNGFIVAGWSNSNDLNVSGNNGSRDYWILKLTKEFQVGIAPIMNSFISAYPNPVQSQLTVILPAPSEDFLIRVYDLMGESVTLPMTIHNDKANMSTSNLSNGLYTLEIINKVTETREVAKFFKD